MYSRLESYIKKIESNFKNISQKRKNILIQLNNYLLHKYKNKQTANLILFVPKIAGGAILLKFGQLPA